MLANVAHSPAWRNQGYVCLACRRQRLATDRRRSQRRLNSTQTERSSESSYSWYDALNDISDDYSAKPRQSSKPAADKSNASASAIRSDRATKEGSSDRNEGRIDGLRLRLDEEIARDSVKDLESASSNDQARGIRRFGGTQAGRLRSNPQRPLRRLSPARVSSRGPRRAVKVKTRTDDEIPEQSVGPQAHWEVKKDLANEASTDPSAADAKSRIIADLMDLVKEGAVQRTQEVDSNGKNDSQVKDEETVPSADTLRSTDFSIRRVNSDSTLAEKQLDRSNQVSSPSIAPSDDHQGARFLHPVSRKFAESSQSLNMPNDALTGADVQPKESSATSEMLQTHTLDRPMTLVERWHANQKRTVPWGVSTASNAASPKPSLRSQKAAPRKASEPLFAGTKVVKTATRGQLSVSANADKPSTSGEMPSSSGLSESIGKILIDMKNRAGSDSNADGPGLATLTADAQDVVTNMGEVELSGQDESLKSLSAHASEDVPAETSTSLEEATAREADPSESWPAQPETDVHTLDDLPPGVSSSGSTPALAEKMPEHAAEQIDGSYSSIEAIPLEVSSDQTPEGVEAVQKPSTIAEATALDQPLGQSGEVGESDVKQAESRSPALSSLDTLWKQRESVAAVEKKEAESDGSHKTPSFPCPPQDREGSRHPRLTRSFHTKSFRRLPASGVAQQDTVEAEQEETPSNAEIKSIDASALEVTALDIPQPPVPFLEYGLDRVLFNPGVYQLQDPTSRVYNFDPYLQKIMPVAEFDFDSLKEYKTSSEDQALSKLAKTQNKKYIGSTSSMTSSLAHFHYLLSNWRPINLSMLSSGFHDRKIFRKFTELNRAPSAIFLRWKDGTYAIDADKEYDGANVLMLLGKSMELLLTLPTAEYERYRKSDPREVSEAQKTAPESYQYTTMRDFLMRSQLDAYDPRLPGNGTFDLKTRAVVSVRMQSQDFEPMTGYEIYGLQGKWGSYEREYYDMMRSTMLKYMLQARMGRMNGIFVAYHNVKRIFGFQYIPMVEMDRVLHGQTESYLGDQEFKASLEIMNELFNKATAKFPGQSLRFHFETAPAKEDGSPTAMHVFGEPMAEEDIDRIQNLQKAKVQEFERNIMGKSGDSTGPDPKATQSGETGAKDSGAAGLSTNSDADTSFLGSMSSTTTDDSLKPLFYATVIVQSKVNDEPVPEDRPKDLKREDKWEIDYIIKDYEITQHEWALYEDCRARRKYAFTERDDEDGIDAESEGQPRKENSFIKYLKDMAAHGKAFREKVDGLDAGKEIARVDQPLPKEREKIDGVEDYMSWMYNTK